MAEFIINWTDTRTVTSKVIADTQRQAKARLLAGNHIEIDWSGSRNPSYESQIQSIKKKEGLFD